MFESEISPSAPSTLDEIAMGLTRMRLEAGAVSFSELTTRIQHRREASGLSPGAARIPRSTVYDAFLTGRRRIDPDLVAEIVLALGGSEADAEHWRDASIKTMLASSLTSPETSSRSTSTRIPRAVDYPVTATENTSFVLTVFITCLFVNIFAHVPVDPLGLPIYLDMIGTAIAAIALGPWAGAAVGLTSNLLASTVIMDWPGMWFALVNAVGGLLWGFGYHHWRMRSPLKFLLLCTVVALGCTLVAVPILVFVFGGSSGTSQDTLISITGLLGEQLWLAVFSSNMLTSLADKVLSGFLAFGVCALAVHLWRRHSEEDRLRSA